MAIYSLNASIISRGKGHSSTAAAAYRARTIVLDERSGCLHDYSRKADDLIFAGLYAPKDAPAWARDDRAQLWNMVEHSEKRKDAQLARDFKIALPHELTPEQNRWLVQDFVRENFTRRHYVADVAIHAPSAQGDDRNIHAHIMVTMRTLGAEGFAKTKDRAMNSKEQLQSLRESWEKLANKHLERYGHTERVDRRTLQAQGIDREPGIHLGKDATAAARKGHTTERGERQQAITTRNRRAEELLRELAALQQQNGIAAQFRENAMAWYDTAFDRLTTIAAFPLGFLMGDVLDFKTPTGHEQTTEINIHTNEVTIQPTTPVVEPGQAIQPAEALQEVAPQRETVREQAMMERQAFEAQWYRDHSPEPELEREREI